MQRRGRWYNQKEVSRRSGDNETIWPPQCCEINWSLQRQGTFYDMWVFVLSFTYHSVNNLFPVFASTSAVASGF